MIPGADMSNQSAIAVLVPQYSIAIVYDWQNQIAAIVSQVCCPRRDETVRRSTGDEAASALKIQASH